jgi:23S rRNA (guanine2445-N2)-methyltransferase / 23S rRNA (guanine2069-N7)-methyltransferase
MPSQPSGRGAERYVYFATCAPGAEPFLHAEIKALGLAKHERQVGGVQFEGTARDAWRANLWLRSAVRVLRRVARFEAPDEARLDAGVAEVDWSRFLRPDGRLWIDAQAKESTLSHSRFVAQRVKDGIVDQLRAADGTRPEIERDEPDLRAHVHLFRDRATLSVDTSGASLHLRGWRVAQGQAPLAETLAATVVLASGWDRRSPLVDPFCGSGTLLVEAALLAANIAPGLTRARFGFESWIDHYEAGWQRERATAAAARVAVPKLRLVARDRDAARVDETSAHLTALGIEAQCTFEVGAALGWRPRAGWNAHVLSNLPYGERIGEDEDIIALHREFGALLRTHASGYSASLLVGSPSLAKRLSLQGERLELVNGGLDVVLLNAALR